MSRRTRRLAFTSLGGTILLCATSLAGAQSAGPTASAAAPSASAATPPAGASTAPAGAATAPAGAATAPASASMRLGSPFETGSRRAWLGGALVVPLRSGDREGKVQIGKVTLSSGPAPGDVRLDLTAGSEIRADRGELQVALHGLRPQDEAEFKQKIDGRRGLFGGSKAYLCIHYHEAAAMYPGATDVRSSAPMCEPSEEGPVVQMEIEIVDRMRAALMGLAAVIASLVAVNAMLLGRAPPAPGDLPPRPATRWQRLCALLNPLRATTGASGSYSLSLAQVMIWTLVTIFGLIYVWLMTESILAPSEQELLLLGIGGLTAVLSQAGKLRGEEVEPRIVQAATEPKLGDLVKMDGLPSVFKFQMLVFTIISAAIVLKELIATCRFPALPGELVTLMGISSATYVGNKVLRPPGASG